MSKITWISALATCSFAIAAVGFGAIGSAQASGTALTLTLTGGSLEISAPATADLGSAVTSSAGTVYSAQLGDIVVTDDRGASAGAGWIASAISTALTPPAGPAIAATYISYTDGTITTTGTVTCANNDPTTIIGVSPVVTATAVSGSNTATWNPTLTIHIAGTFVAGVYTGSITHSVT